MFYVQAQRTCLSSGRLILHQITGRPYRAKCYNLYMYSFISKNITRVMVLSLLFTSCVPARISAALPQFLGGSGMGVNGNKANIDGNYPTFWDNLMMQQSYYNMYQGLREMSMSKYKEAEQTFAKAVIKNPKEPYSHVFLGIALYWQGQVDPAMAEYNTAIELDPKNAEAHQLLGIAYAWKGDIKSALESFKKAVAINPDRPDTQMNIGSTYAALGNLDDALFHFRNAVNLDKNHPLYQYQLGSLYEVLGRDSNAEESFKNALRLYPGYEEVMLALAVLYEKSNKSTLAEINYKKALKIKPGDSVARLRLANLLAKEGRKAEAMETLNRAFLISPLMNQGLALSISYTGGATQPSASAKSEESSQPEQEQKNKQLEQFKRRLEKIPSAKQVNIEVEILLEPKLKTPKIEIVERKELLAIPKGRTSALADAVEAKDKQEASTAFTRTFILTPSSEEERVEQLSKIFTGLNNALKEGAKNYDVKMALRAGAPATDSGSLGDNSAGTGPTSSIASNSKAGYNPYMVGNDMGLWVAGKGWIKYIQDIMPEVNARLSGGKAQDYIVAGAAYLTLGRGADALESFTIAEEMSGAEENGKKLKELSGLGKGTAYIILGDEENALKEYRAVAGFNPENRVALSNIEILTTTN